MRQLLLVFLLVFSIVSAQSQEHGIIKESDTIIVCKGTSVTISAVEGFTYRWFPEDILDRADSITVVASPSISGYLYLESSLDDDIFLDSVWLEVIEAAIEISLESVLPDTLCEGTPVQLSAAAEPQGGEITWLVRNREVAQGDNIEIPAPRFRSLVARYLFRGCTAFDTITLPVIEFGVPKPAFEDTTVCRGQSVRLASSTGSLNTLYRWTPSLWLNNDTIPNPIATPRDTTKYQLVYSSFGGECIDSFELNINVIPIQLNLDIPDTVFLCLGDSILITATVDGQIAGLSWGPDDGGLSSLTGTQIIAKPDYTNYYFARYESNGCVIVDSFLIQVDSLPQMPITIIVEEEKYCPGEIVVFLSPEYNSILYPGIKHTWTPQDESLISDPEFYNLTITTIPGERIYTRTTENGGCKVEDQVTIFVKDPQILVTPEDTIVCPGAQFRYQILNDVEDIQWNPGRGLSCSDCPNPIVTALENITYQITGKVEDCPASKTVRVRVFSVPVVSIQISPLLQEYAQGETVVLRAGSTPPLPDGTIYEWEFNGIRVNSTADSIEVVLSEEVNVVVVKTTTPEGCPIEVQRTIVTVPPFYQVPNAFSPNNDNINDEFRVFTRGNITVTSMEIYNRFGQLMFRGNDNTGWDGRFQGVLCPPEVYAYKITLLRPDGRTVVERGDVTLVR